MSSNKGRVFAIAAHPDDIEFMMAGTLFRLKAAGYELHYMNIANGSCGSAEFNAETTARIRLEEGREAAEYLGATFHEPLVPDLEIFYERDTLARLGSIMREVAPDILLTQYPFDYMEDHNNSVRLAVTAAFCRGMRNFPVVPERDPVAGKVTVYHAMPYGLKDPMRNTPTPDLFIDISDILTQKREMLGKHRSQKEWLDTSQGMDSYLIEMENQAQACGKLSGAYTHAEGWFRRLHLGFCSPEDDPLSNLSE